MDNLDQAISIAAEKLKDMDPSSDEYTVATDNVAKLAEAKQKVPEKKNNVLEYVKIGLTALGIILPIAFKAWASAKSWQFEETGVYRSQTSKQNINDALR